MHPEQVKYVKNKIANDRHWIDYIKDWYKGLTLRVENRAWVYKIKD